MNFFSLSSSLLSELLLFNSFKKSSTKLLWSFKFSVIGTFFGKFVIVGTVWSFSFQILSEIRHLFWDLGLGFELKTSNITGLLVIFGSFILTIFIFILGRSLVL